jgi:hypothetical protein
MTTRSPRLAVLLLVIAGLALAIVALSQGLGRLGPPPFNLVVDGQDITSRFDLSGLDSAQRLLAAGATLAVSLVLLTVLLVVVPVAMLALVGLLLAVVLGGVAGAVGLPLLAIALVLCLLLSPLLLLAMLLRWLLK